MAIKITRGDVTIEVEIDEKVEIALAAIAKIFRVSLMGEMEDSSELPALFPMPASTARTGYTHGKENGINAASARSLPLRRMPVRDSIKLIFADKRTLMSPDDLHLQMAFHNPRYKPTAKDPIHNIKQVLRGNENEFKQWQPGLWQLTTWTPASVENTPSPSNQRSQHSIIKKTINDAS